MGLYDSILSMSDKEKKRQICEKSGEISFSSDELDCCENFVLFADYEDDNNSIDQKKFLVTFQEDTNDIDVACDKVSNEISGDELYVSFRNMFSMKLPSKKNVNV